jgi:TPR repeat protein
MKSAEQGNSLAQLAVGICYLNGYGVPQDNTKALNWSQKAAEQGNLKAKELVALLHAKEKKNWSESHKLWHEIADNNDTNAKYFIGVSYSQIMNNEAALFLSYVWFSIAANAGHKEAAIDRENVEKMMPVESINDAQDFINNWKPGRLTIDAMKIINVIGTSNYTKFLTYQKFLTIANQMKECPENKHLFEVIYCLFKPASITDNNEQKKAIEKIEEFAEYGNVLSQYMLAYIYEQGIIMPRNVSKSFLWAGIARKNGLNKAIEIQQKIIDDMSNVQLVAAATIIESWKPKSHIHPTG